MKTWLLLLFFLFPALGFFAQDDPPPVGGAEKSLTSPSTVHRLSSTVTRAVVVGISDYQDKGIPDLQYAHLDAGAFANFLRSSAGGSLHDDHLKVLLNEEATAAQFATALDWLMEVSKEGDQAIIYFSGHGDVEKKTLNQPGFLLCWDAPARVYMAGGAFGLPYLQEIISTLSLQNKAKVIVITDACRSGKLAGSAVGGAQITGSNLAKQYANEIKILSCQPNEYSVEGRQWGGGRGVFSYYLVDGLYGLADRNEDQVVTLTEIDRFLEDHVTADVAPDHQQPMVLGDKSKSLSRVIPELLAAVQQNKTGDLSTVENRGLEDEVLRRADSLTRDQYRRFKEALAAGDLLGSDSGKASADALFSILIKVEVLQPLHNQMRRNFAAALLDEVQQALNALLANDPYEANNYKFNPGKYAGYPDYLQRSLELLGEKHYMYRSVLSKKYFFEGYNLAKTHVQSGALPALRDSLKEVAKSKYLEAIRLQPEAAYLYYAIGDLYANNLPNQTDSLVLWCSRAVELAPGWVVPMLDMFYEYKHIRIDMSGAEQWIERALKVNPDNYLVQEQLSWLRQAQGRTDEVIAICQEMIEEKPDLFNAYNTLAYTHYQMTGDYLEAERNFEMARARNVPPNYTLEVLAQIYNRTRRYGQSILLLKNGLESSNIPPETRGSTIAYLVEAYIRQGDFEAAERRAKEIFDGNWGAANDQVYTKTQLGRMRLLQRRYEEAAAFFRDALRSDPAPDSYFITDLACLGEVARLQNQAEQAEAFYKQALTYSSKNIWMDMPVKEEAWFLYGRFLLGQNRPVEAADCFQKSMDMRKMGPWGEYGFALLAAGKGKKQEALDWLEKSLDNFYPDPESIMAEPIFHKIHNTARFKALMGKHFPENAAFKK